MLGNCKCGVTDSRCRSFVLRVRASKCEMHVLAINAYLSLFLWGAREGSRHGVFHPWASWISGSESCAIWWMRSLENHRLKLPGHFNSDEICEETENWWHFRKTTKTSVPNISWNLAHQSSAIWRRESILGEAYHPFGGENPFLARHIIHLAERIRSWRGIEHQNSYVTQTVISCVRSHHYVC